MMSEDGPLTQVYIGLGGNVGNVLSNFQAALQAIDQSLNCTVISVSNVYKTPPWGVEDQDWFHNACAEIATSLEPLELLAFLKELEQEAEREDTVRWGPRTLDLDILLYGNLELETSNLSIPHPRMIERAFVLLPLREIAKKLEIQSCPIAHWLGQTIFEECESLNLEKTWWQSPIAQA